MLTDESWSIRFETMENTLAFETVLSEVCGALAVSVSRPYLDAPFWVVEGFCDFAPDKDVVTAALRCASEVGEPPEFSIVAHGKRDWLAENRASFPALHIGRFWVHGSHITDKPPVGAKPLHVDAAEAFGSGTHPTTEGCLRLIDDILKKRKPHNALDLGAGSAILAMAVLKMVPYARMIASDIEQILANQSLGRGSPHQTKTHHQVEPYRCRVMSSIPHPRTATAVYMECLGLPCRPAPISQAGPECPPLLYAAHTSCNRLLA